MEHHNINQFVFKANGVYKTLVSFSWNHTSYKGLVVFTLEVYLLKTIIA